MAIDDTRSMRAQWSRATSSQRAITVGLLILSLICLVTAFRNIGYIFQAGRNAVR